VTERLDRAVRRRLLKEDQPMIGRALGVGHNYDVRAEQANTRHLALMLRDTGKKHRASAAADFTFALYTATVAKSQSEPIACAQGCSHCCRTYVSATVPEILRLAGRVRSEKVKMEKIVAAGAHSAAVPQDERWRDKVWCPNLENSMCSVYEHRPLACRTMLSKSLPACVSYFVDDVNAEIPSPRGAAEARGRVELVLCAALILAGLPARHYELNHALAVAVTDAQAEERWLAGEPLFAAVAVDRYEGQNQDVSNWVKVLVDTVRPTL
jgi:Fe-S-cluster containining protein